MLQVSAIDVNEDPTTLRRKVEIARQQAVGGILPQKTVDADYTSPITDSGFSLLVDSALGMNWTLPKAFPVGWWCMVSQVNAGQATFLPELGATVQALGGTARTAGQWARVWVEVVGNADGQSAVWLVSGDVG